MALSYAGQDLLLVPPDLQAFLDRWLPTVETKLFSDMLGAANTNRCESRNPNATNRVGLARPNYPDRPPLRVNELYWPTGATRWGQFIGLADTPTKDKILDAVGRTGSPVKQTLVLLDESRTPNIRLAPSMHLLPPRRLTAVELGGRNTDREQFWLIPLVDDRWQWQFRNTGDMSLDAGETWSSFYNMLAARLDVTIDADTVPSTYLFPDPYECSRQYESVAVLLDAAAHSVGQRIVRGLDGNIRATGWERSQTNFEANAYKKWLQAAGGDFEDYSYATQASMSLLCPKYTTKMQACGWKEYTSSLGSGFSGTYRTIHTTAAATFATFGASNPSNATALQALADQIATDHALSLKFYDIAFCGLLDWTPVGWDDSISWTIGRLSEDGGHLAHTRVQSQPYNFGVDEMLHQIEDRVFPAGSYVMQTTSTVASGAWGTATVYEWSGTSLSSTGVAVSVYNSTGSDVASGVSIQTKHDGCAALVDVEDC